MDNKKNGIPKLRFPGFTGAWEQRKFSEILAKSDGLRRGPFGSALKKEFFISSSEYTVYEQNNAIYNTWKTRYFITPEKFQELHKFQLMPGDFILSGAGTIGRIAQVPANITKGVFNQALIRIRINPEWMDKKFFLIWMQSENMQRKLTQANPGSAMTNLVPMSEIKKWEIIIPSKTEQNKIGEFIQKLNSLIALHQRKLEHLQEQKKGLLQKMFPKNGETVPEVRFPGFTDAWEQRKLGEFFKKYQNKIFLDDETKYIQISVRNTGKVEYRTTNYGKDIGRKRQYLVDTKHYPDTLTFTRQTIYEGGIGYIPNSLNGAIVTENMPLLAKNSKLDKDFSKILFKTHLYYHNVIEKNKPIGSAQKALHEKVWLDCIVLVPSLHEQQKIGNFFKQLDSLITLHQRKLEHLELMKKGLLQQMFV